MMTSTAKKTVNANRHSFGFKDWLHLHQQACLASLKKLAKTPLANLFTLLMIGVTLTLPLIFWTSLENLNSLSKSWQQSDEITVFLKPEVSLPQAELLRKQLKENAVIAKIDLISAEQGLQQLSQALNIQALTQHLEKNPLPVVFRVYPILEINTSEEVEQLAKELQAQADVDFVQYNSAWVKQFFQILDVGRHFVLILSILLGLGIVLIISNSLHLIIDNAKEEIAIYKMVGATQSFIRRPFLYLGVMYGLGGALLAWLINTAMLFYLAPTVNNFLSLYNANLTLASPSLWAQMGLFIGTIGLGWLASWIATTRQLRNIEPD